MSHSVIYDPGSLSVQEGPHVQCVILCSNVCVSTPQWHSAFAAKPHFYMLLKVLPTLALALFRVTHSPRGKSEPDGRLSVDSGNAPFGEGGSISSHFCSL